MSECVVICGNPELKRPPLPRVRADGAKYHEHGDSSHVHFRGHFMQVSCPSKSGNCNQLPIDSFCGVYRIRFGSLVCSRFRPENQVEKMLCDGAKMWQRGGDGIAEWLNALVYRAERGGEVHAQSS